SSSKFPIYFQKSLVAAQLATSRPYFAANLSGSKFPIYFQKSLVAALSLSLSLTLSFFSQHRCLPPPPLCQHHCLPPPVLGRHRRIHRHHNAASIGFPHSRLHRRRSLPLSFSTVISSTGIKHPSLPPFPS
ncbi:hypothetical protein Pfo_005451, partial [Paulownia fortunei]